MKLADPLLCFFLKRRRGRREIRIFVSEKFVGNFAGEQYANICPLMDRPADQIHSDAGADRGNIIRSENADQRIQHGGHFARSHEYFRMIASNIRSCLSGVFQIDGILAHSYGECFDRNRTLLRGDGAYKRRVQSAGKKESDFCVRDQPFFHSRDQLLADIPAGCLQIIMADRIHLRDIGITDEPAVLIVMPGRERHDLFGQPHQVFRLAGKEDDPLFIEAVIQRPNPDGIPRGNISAGFVIINDAGKFRIQHSEHFCPVLPVQRK